MSNKSDNLASKHCAACSGELPRLKGRELAHFLERLGPGWAIREDLYLEKEYSFPDFKQALHFTNEIGKIAEEEGHHPDVHLSWGKVKVSIWTHHIHGLSESDFILAAKCDEQYKHYPFSKDF